MRWPSNVVASPSSEFTSSSFSLGAVDAVPCLVCQWSGFSVDGVGVNTHDPPPRFLKKCYEFLGPNWIPRAVVRVLVSAFDEPPKWKRVASNV